MDKLKGMFASVAVRVHSSRSKQGCVAVESLSASPMSNVVQGEESSGPLHQVTNSLDMEVHVEMEAYTVR